MKLIRTTTEISCPTSRLKRCPMVSMKSESCGPSDRQDWYVCEHGATSLVISHRWIAE